MYPTSKDAALPVSYWNDRPVPELIDFIIEGHHVFTRAAIARIGALLNDEVPRHGERYPELKRVSTAFRELAGELGPHMMREERVLFPHIRALATPEESPSPAFCTVRVPVRLMMQQHDSATDLLAEIQEASNDFKPAEDACASHAALYAALAELRVDLLKHMSLENDMLFGRAIALEDQRRTPPPRSSIVTEHQRPVR